jgi:hypothetical protein
VYGSWLEILAFGFSIGDHGSWIVDFGFSILDLRAWHFGSEGFASWIPDFRLWVLESEFGISNLGLLV